MEEEPLFEEAHNSSDEYEAAYDSDNNPFCMEKYMISEDTNIIEGSILAEKEDEDQDDDSDDDSEEEQVHYEGDTEVEDLFEMEEEEQEKEEEEVNVVAGEEPPMEKPTKRRKKLAVRRGPTSRSHSNVLEEVKPDFIHSSEEEDDGLLFQDEDDGHELLSFVLTKGRKGRAKKRKPRIWYNDKLQQPHQQLCLYMCFKDQQKFRDDC
nr:nucleolin-like [Aegilops tauschii subsp. strangulata]